jgi:hypothetical protein
METSSTPFCFPNDVVFKIVSKLDIDTRRSLGIYTKITVPSALANAISTSFSKLILGKYHAFVELGPQRIVFPEEPDDRSSMYKISRSLSVVLCVDSKNYVIVEYNVEHVNTTLNTSGDYYTMHNINSYDVCDD